MKDRWAWRLSIAAALLSIPLIVDYTTTKLIESIWLYTGAGLIGTIGIAVGVRIHRPQRPSAWYLIAGGNLLFVIGDLVYKNLSSAGPAPFPGVADVFYLAGYPFIAVGIARLVGGSGRKRGNLIDAAIIAASVGLLGWVFLMEPYASDPSLTMAQRLVSIAYPLCDLLLLATICWFFFGESRRNASLNWLLLASAGLLVSDTIYGYQVLEGTYIGGWTDTGYIIGYLVLASAGLHPAMRSLIPRVVDASQQVSRKRLVLLGTCLVLGPGLLALSAAESQLEALGIHFHRVAAIDPLVVTVGTFLLLMLTFVRMVGLMRSAEQNSALLEAQGKELGNVVEELNEAEKGRRHLLEAVHTTAEDERSSLALDLHDGPIQHLTTLAFEVDLATIGFENGDRTATREALLALELGLSAEVESLRALMMHLRPPVLDERGLAQAMKDQLSAFEARTKIQCEIELDIDARRDRGIETILYRIVQEALINVAKHSRAQRVMIRCRTRDGVIELDVTDDGIGFDPRATDTTGSDGHLGLASIRERVGFIGGRCSIESVPGRGTRVSVRLDLEGNESAEATRVAG